MLLVSYLVEARGLVVFKSVKDEAFYFWTLIFCERYSDQEMKHIWKLRVFSLLCWVAHHFGNSVCNKNVLMTLKRVWRTCIISTLAQEIRTCEQISSCRNNPPSALDSNTVPSEGNCRSRALSFQLKAGNLNLRAEKKKSFIWVLGSFRNLDVLLWFIVQPRSSCLSVSKAGRWGQDPFSAVVLVVK